MATAPGPLDALRFDNSYVREVDGDSSGVARSRQVEHAGWSKAAATPVSNPRLVAWSAEVAADLGLAGIEDARRFAQVFAGNETLPGMQPFAACYGGHQFGHWAGQLGDGRALTLGEVLTPSGARQELQLKGAGPTPYSRGSDGRAVLRSSIREFLCSEAMHHLGVPTTRALSLVRTGDAVVRDILYQGDPRPEPGAIVCRVAPSFLRFGHFELPAVRGDLNLLGQLMVHALRRHHPEIVPEFGLQRGAEPKPGAILGAIGVFFKTVAERTAELMDHWMRVGFVHGVMNTDNLSILGLTLDYGPYGWIDVYDPDWTPNTTDAQGRRYRFGHQPMVAHWNLLQLARALYPLAAEAGGADAGGTDRAEAAMREGLDHYQQVFDQRAGDTLAAKLGLRAFGTEAADLGARLHLLMQRHDTDMTRLYRALARVPAGAEASPEARLAALGGAFYGTEAVPEAVTADWSTWLNDWTAQVRRDAREPAERVAAMNAVNPRYVLRNFLAQQAIDAAEQGDDTEVNALLDLLRRPYDDQPEHAQKYDQRRPEWARNKPGCSMLSCSS